MKTVAIVVCCLMLGLGGFIWPVVAQETPPGDAPAPGMSEDEKMLYTLGLALAQNLQSLELTEVEFKLVVDGLSDVVLGEEPKVKLQEYGPKIQGFIQARMLVVAEKEKGRATEFLAAEAAKPGAVKTESGLIYTELLAGTGESPKATDTVTVHYHGTLRDGSVFDSSVERGTPSSFPLNGVITGWTEGLQLMKVGGKARLVCPANLAYGDQGRPGIPGGAALVFEVELISIDKQ